MVYLKNINGKHGVNSLPWRTLQSNAPG